ncbi:MAG: hypothetical protein ACK5EA_06690 [Planctomycetaceae bacterium]
MSTIDCSWAESNTRWGFRVVLSGFWQSASDRDVADRLVLVGT